MCAERYDTLLLKRSLLFGNNSLLRITFPRITNQSGNPGTLLREAEPTYNEFLKGAHISLKHILSFKLGFVLHKQLLISSKQPNLFLTGSFNTTMKNWSFKEPTVFVFGKYFPGCYTLVLPRLYLSYLQYKEIGVT